MGKENKDLLKRILANTELIMANLKIKAADTAEHKKPENKPVKTLPAKKAAVKKSGIKR